MYVHHELGIEQCVPSYQKVPQQIKWQTRVNCNVSTVTMATHFTTVL